MEHSNFALKTQSQPGYASFGSIVMRGTAEQAQKYANLHKIVEGIEVSVKPTNYIIAACRLEDEIQKLQDALIVAIEDGIIEAIDFTDSEELEGSDFSPEALVKIRNYATAFVAAFDGQSIERLSNYNTANCMGNDVWFTTQGHGVGFWETDRYVGASDWCDQYCKAHRLGEAYKGDDNLVYLF
jgi:hypothetical protein